MDAYIAMIPKADGDSTPLGHWPLSALPVVYTLWASLRHASEVCHDYNLKSDDEQISLKETFGLCEGRAEQHYYIPVRASRYTCVLGW